MVVIKVEFVLIIGSTGRADCQGSAAGRMKDVG
jgi:hypothetical protein